jgi:quaternary ammonium compound-resistance protein SugE
MAWSILMLAGMFEIGWAVGLKYTDGLSRLVPAVWTALSMAVSVALLGVAMKDLPLGNAYAVWTGIGAIGTAAAGIILFGEAVTSSRLLSIGLIVAGIVGLRFAAS